MKLIDFDHAAISPEANERPRRFGTIGCAAPEQYTFDQILDQRTDIYAIGAVLRFMTEGTLEGESRADVTEAFARIIRKCMDPDREKRYSFAREAGSALEQLCVRELPLMKESKAVSSLKVVLTGSRPGAGTTHLAFGLCAFLTAQGYKVLYEEHNPSQAVHTLARLGKVRSDSYGIYSINRCCMKPWYGPAVQLEKPTGFQIVLVDCGTDWRLVKAELKDGGTALLVAAGGSPWEQGAVERMAEALEESGRGRARLLFLFRHMSARRFKALGVRSRLGHLAERRSGAEVFSMPEFADPFRLTGEAEAFLKTIWEVAAGSGQRKKGWGWAEKLKAGKALLTNTGLLELSEQDGGQE